MDVPGWPEPLTKVDNKKRSMQFHHTTLPNGLEVVAELNDDAYSVAFGFYVKTGARDETTHSHLICFSPLRLPAQGQQKIFNLQGTIPKIGLPLLQRSAKPIKVLFTPLRLYLGVPQRVNRVFAAVFASWLMAGRGLESAA